MRNMQNGRPCTGFISVNIDRCQRMQGMQLDEGGIVQAPYRIVICPCRQLTNHYPCRHSHEWAAMLIHPAPCKGPVLSSPFSSSQIRWTAASCTCHLDKHSWRPLLQPRHPGAGLLTRLVQSFCQKVAPTQTQRSPWHPAQSI